MGTFEVFFSWTGIGLTILGWVLLAYKFWSDHNAVRNADKRGSATLTRMCVGKGGVLLLDTLQDICISSLTMGVERLAKTWRRIINSSDGLVRVPETRRWQFQVEVATSVLSHHADPSVGGERLADFSELDGMAPLAKAGDKVKTPRERISAIYDRLLTLQNEGLYQGCDLYLIAPWVQKISGLSERDGYALLLYEVPYRDLMHITPERASRLQPNAFLPRAAHDGKVQQLLELKRLFEQEPEHFVALVLPE